MTLTKDLLNYKIRKGELFPAFLNLDDPKVQSLCSSRQKVFLMHVGQDYFTLQNTLKDEQAQASLLDKGLNKLFLSICQLEEVPCQEEQRLKVLLHAQEMRESKVFDTFKHFQEEFALAYGTPFNIIHKELYSDLPERRILKKFQPLSSQEIINKYNRSLLSGILLQATELKLTCHDESIGFKRSLFRIIKFHQLLADVIEDSPFTVTLGGPAGIKQNSKVYGSRLRNFLSHIRAFPSWEMDATLKIKSKEVLLKLSSKDWHDPSKPLPSQYVPKELSAAIQTFNALDSDWECQAGGEFFNMGDGSYCFPDMVFTHPNGQKFHLELFHQWFSGQLTERLKAMEKRPQIPYIMGVCRSLSQKEKTQKLLNQSAWFLKNGLIYKEFPTSKKILATLKQL